MMFKNSFKLLISNFSAVWKIMLYKFLVVLITVGLFCASLGVLTSMDSFHTLFSGIVSFFSNYSLANISNVLVELFNLLQIALICVKDLITLAPFWFAYLCVVAFVVFPYLWHLTDLAVSECFYSYMSSQVKTSYLQNFIGKFNKASLYSIIFTGMLLPINAIFVGGLVGLLYCTQVGGLMLYFLPYLILLFALVFISLRLTLFSGWLPSITVTDASVISSCKKGLKVLSKRFFRSLSNFVATITIFLFAMTLFGLFGFIVLYPVISVFNIILGSTMYFGSQGMRYYVDADTILKPKRLEQTDKMKYMVDII